MLEPFRAVAVAALIVFLAGFARGDTLDQIRARGAIRWGGDQEGGGPYIYPVPEDPQRLTGFEVELMELIARRLGVRSEFQQCEWDNLPNLLAAKDIDVIVNGYELTPERLGQMAATIPYYVYELQLLARRDNPAITSWEKLEQGPRKSVGVLKESAADKYVAARLGGNVAIETYTGNTVAMDEVRSKLVDATVQDLPIAIFYRNRYPELHFVDQPVSPGFYVMYVRHGDERLRDSLNAALLELINDGELKMIYERYGLWNTMQEKLGTPGLGSTVQASETRGWLVIQRNWRLLLQSAGMTVLLSCLAMPLAITLGLLVALGRLYGPTPLRCLLAVYVEVLRGTPFFLQLLIIYFVLRPALGWHLDPIHGVNLDPIIAAVLGLAINYSAYEAEIYRAGLLAIPAGQMEAALALGMSRVTALRRIVVPQAVRLVIPPVTNDFIALFKDTSICSTITVVELTKQFYILVNNTNAKLELAAVTALLYLLMSFPLSLLARRLEHKSAHLAM